MSTKMAKVARMRVEEDYKKLLRGLDRKAHILICESKDFRATLPPFASLDPKLTKMYNTHFELLATFEFSS
jgi:hypothetical protein